MRKRVSQRNAQAKYAETCEVINGGADPQIPLPTGRGFPTEWAARPHDHRPSARRVSRSLRALALSPLQPSFPEPAEPPHQLRRHFQEAGEPPPPLRSPARKLGEPLHPLRSHFQEPGDPPRPLQPHSQEPGEPPQPLRRSFPAPGTPPHPLQCHVRKPGAPLQQPFHGPKPRFQTNRLRKLLDQRRSLKNESAPRRPSNPEHARRS
jgi:hypothetical protein